MKSVDFGKTNAVLFNKWVKKSISISRQSDNIQNGTFFAQKSLPNSGGFICLVQKRQIRFSLRC